MQIQVKSVSSRISARKGSVIQMQNLDELQATKAVSCENSNNKELLKEQSGF